MQQSVKIAIRNDQEFIMAKRLYSFPTTPEAADERDSVCAMLEENGIEYYETPGSTWGFSKASVWIKNDEEIDRARQLFAEHSMTYAEQARQRYQQQTGYNPEASFRESLHFHLKHFLQRKKLFLPLIAAAALLYLYFDMFLGLFFNQ